ncbi:MAG: hypothetical protein HQL32_14525 [Planctomycetes bacterium]|nr:hypothetical protein [Planctomycetota bacterium]
MEEDDSGYKATKVIRETYEDERAKIVVRTGQPGLDNNMHTHENLKIDGFFYKTDLSSDKLRQITKSALQQL